MKVENIYSYIISSNPTNCFIKIVPKVIVYLTFTTRQR